VGIPKCDIVIVGGGPAGLTAGLYCCRSGKRTILVEGKGLGGQLATAPLIENYPGTGNGISGIELVQNMQNQAVKFGLEIIYQEAKNIVEGKNGLKRVEAEDGTFQANAIIVASGVHHRRLDVPGEKEFMGKGISYCATCDGPLYRDQDVAVIGGGNAAAEEALFLTNFVHKIFLIHRRDKLRAVKILQDRLFSNSNIEVKWDSIINEIKGKQSVESVILKNLKNDKEYELQVSGIFVSIGYRPNTDFLKGILALDENGYIETKDNMSTSSRGIFACGDCRKKMLRQVVTACGDGALAAVQAIKYVDENTQ